MIALSQNTMAFRWIPNRTVQTDSSVTRPTGDGKRERAPRTMSKRLWKKPISISSDRLRTWCDDWMPFRQSCRRTDEVHESETRAVVLEDWNPPDQGLDGAIGDEALNDGGKVFFTKWTSAQQRILGVNNDQPQGRRAGQQKVCW
jgi:hypothetical protein